MARLAAGQKAARAVALTAARAALRGAGAAEVGGMSRARPTASVKAVHHAHGSGVRVRKIRLRKIRIRA